MASQSILFRQPWKKRDNGHKQSVGRPSNTGAIAAQSRRDPARVVFPSVAGALAASAILACAFGQMPDEANMINATVGEKEVGASRQVIDNFLADSAKYLGL